MANRGPQMKRNSQKPKCNHILFQRTMQHQTNVQLYRASINNFVIGEAES